METVRNTADRCEYCGEVDGTVEFGMCRVCAVFVADAKGERQDDDDDIPALLQEQPG